MFTFETVNNIGIIIIYFEDYWQNSKEVLKFTGCTLPICFIETCNVIYALAQDR
jgi:hypothetical protein